MFAGHAPALLEAVAGALYHRHIRAAVRHASEQLLDLQHVGRLCGRRRLA